MTQFDRIATLFIFLGALFLTQGCKSESESPKPVAPEAEGNTAPAESAEEAPAAEGNTAPAESAEGAPEASRVRVADITLAAPAGWVQQTPMSRMRLAQFSLPRAEGDDRDGTLSVIAAGGDIDANITRWKGQFEGGEPEVTREDGEVAGMPLTQVTMRGTYLHKARPMAPGPGTPQPGTIVRTAIIKTPATQLFFKAWGPEATLNHWSEAFDQMVQGLLPAR